MKEKILKLLKQNQGVYISGQDISAQLGITRAAVWKYIKQLESEGYIIESVTKKGYKLSQCPDILTYEEVGKLLNTKIMGRKIAHFEILDSTNNKARELAENGEPEGTIVIAEEQASGRGRKGRKWFSQNRLGIWVSIILRPNVELSKVPLITMTACAAIGLTVKNAAGFVEIKWPNDIYLNNKKIAGILTQVSGETEKSDYVILGIGINANESFKDFPDNLKEKASSIKEVTGKYISRKQFLSDFLLLFEEMYLEFKASGKAAKAADVCRQNSCTTGRKLLINMNGEKISAKVISLGDNGELIAELENGEVIKISADDVFTIL